MAARILILDLPGPAGVSCADALGDALAAGLRRAMLRDLAEMAAGIDAAAAWVFSAEADACARLPVEAHRPPWAPERAVEEAFSRAFQAGPGGAVPKGVVLLASDAPTFPEPYLWGALDILLERSVCVSPAAEGGFALLGLARAAADSAQRLFAGLDWRRPDALAAFIGRVGETGLSVGILPPWYRVVDARSLGLLRGHLAALRAEGNKRLPQRTASFIEGAFG